MNPKTNFYGLRAGTVFSARNKLGETRCYRFLGIDLDELKDDCVGCRYIMLQSMADKTDIFGVEAAWFAQRKITVEGAAPEICNGYAVIESTSVAGTEIVICTPISGNTECASPYVVWLRGQIGSLCCGERFASLEAAQWNLHEKAVAVIRPVAKKLYREQVEGGNQQCYL